MWHSADMPTASSIATSRRLLSLLSLLQVRREWPGAVLAGRLEVSERTVRRDIDRLRELGYPVHAIKGPDGGYRLEAGSELPPLLFDDEQAVALAVALRSAAGIGAGIEDAAARALVTIGQVLPARLRRRVEAVQLSADWRIYRADRMTLRVPRGPRFEPGQVPGGDVAEFLSARFKGAETTGEWPCRGEVILELPAAQVIPFAGDGVVEELGPCRTALVTGSWSWTALAAALLRFDADLEVVGPPPLRDAFAELSRRAGRAYRSGIEK